MKLIQTIVEHDRFARHVGLNVIRVEKGYAEVEMPIRPCHLNAMDMVHGGAIFTLGDYAFALAANFAGNPSVALSVSINFLRPGKAGVLTAKAKELSTAGRVATYLVEICDADAQIVASFQGLAYIKGPPVAKA